jgi:hypothetical protein
MLFEIFPFEFVIQPAQIAGTALWSLACYWLLAPLNDWLMLKLQQWFNFAERSLYTSEQEFERTRVGRESQNAFFASMLSIIPFFMLGGLLHYLVEISLGGSWPISLGLLGCVIGGIYELGRQQSAE